jgi:DNA-binding LytR/AlgR family response regulator
MLKKTKILIVEDEILIADTIQRYLEKRGYQVVRIAISYTEAIEGYQMCQPDLVLIDIRLSGPQTGIDLALFIQQQARPVPFIYLTSQTDSRSIEKAKKTIPAGYLSKPIQPGSLFASIEIALHNHQVKTKNESTLKLSDGTSHNIIRVKEILFLQSDHVYVQIYTGTRGQVLHRGALSELMKELPNPPFVQAHRSFVINLEAVSGWDLQHIFINGQAIPVSRSRRKEIFEYLERSAH